MADPLGAALDVTLARQIRPTILPRFSRDSSRMLIAPNRHRPVLINAARRPSGDRQYVLITCGLVAFVGTGIFAVVDNSNGGTARAPSAPIASEPPVMTAETDRRPRVAAPERAPVRAPLATAVVAARPADEPAYPHANEAPLAPQPAAASAYAAAAPAEAAPISSEGPATTGTFTAPRSAAPPSGSQALADDRARTVPKTRVAAAAASADCPLPVLNAVLADVSARFGTVAVVATHQLKTVNHVSGSAREKLHHDCKAIDFRPDRSRIDEVKAYLRTRSEIAGIESYRDGVIHMDTAGRPGTSPGARWPVAAAAEAGARAVQAP
jgi:hypothetical protein